MTPRDLLTAFALLSLAAGFTLIVVAVVQAKPILLPIAVALVWCSLVMIDAYFHPRPPPAATASHSHNSPDTSKAKQTARFRAGAPSG